MASDTPLAREDFRRLIAISEPRPLTPPGRVWSNEQMRRIRLGLKARDMDERWLALTEKNRLYLHRSWTGFGIYEAVFAPRAEGWQITAAWVESNPERYRVGDDQHERDSLERLIRDVVVNDR